MKRFEFARRVASLAFILLLTASYVAPLRAAGASTVARQDDSAEEAVTFDNLLQADSYMFYVELRNIGQQVKAGGFSGMLEPLLPLFGDMPGEVSRLSGFVLSQSDRLARSRLMFAMQPSKPALPRSLLALELSSADSAREFEPEFKRFLVSVIMAGPVLTQGGPNKTAGADSSAEKESATKESAAIASLPFFIRRAGRLLLVSESSFTLESLRPEGSKLLSDDPHFRAARDRFFSDTLFVYYDARLSEQVYSGKRPEIFIDKTTEEQDGADKSDEQPSPSHEPAQPDKAARESGEAPSATPKRRAAPSEARANKSKSPQSRKGNATRRKAAKVENEVESLDPVAPALSAQPEIFQPHAIPPTGDEAPAASPAPDSFGLVNSYLDLILGGMGRGIFKSPEAIAFALTLEGDEVIIRLLQVSDPADGLSPIPLLSLLPSGPALPPEAAGYVPADTDIFVSASIDLAQMHEFIFAMARGLNPAAAPPVAANKKGGAKPIKSQVAAFEKKYGFKLKEELLASLGNEVAVAIPANLFDSSMKAAPAARPGVALLLSVKNKDVLKARLLAALEAFGLKAPKEKGVTERRGDIEINSYANASIALVNNFLVIAFDRASVSRVVDAYAKNQTLAATKVFHDYVRWQPREVLAQVYVSSAVMKIWVDRARASAATASEGVRDFFARTHIAPEPITYAASPESNGAVYELHLPKSLVVMLMAQMADESKQSLVSVNEAMVGTALPAINEHEKNYYRQHGRYATLEELRSAGFLYDKDYFESLGYKVDMTISGSGYEMTATPVEYGKTGRLSFYTDASGIIRQADHEGRPATAADKPVEKNQQ